MSSGMGQHKLPVMQIAETGYRFVYLNFLFIFRISGLPLLVAALIGVALQYVQFNDMLERIGAGSNPLLNQPTSLLALGFAATLLNGFLAGYAAAPVYRLALYGREQALATPSAAGIAMGAVWAVATAIMILPSLVFAGVDLNPVRPQPPTIFMLASVALFVAMIFSVRFLTIFPDMAVTGTVRAGHNWRLTSGSWWRIVGAFFLAYLPLGFVGLLAAPMFLVGQFGGPPNADRLKQGIESMLANAPVISAISYIFAVATAGIGISISSNIYRHLSGRALNEPLGTPPQQA